MKTKVDITCGAHGQQFIPAEEVTVIESTFPNGIIKRQFRFKCPMDQEIIVEPLELPDQAEFYQLLVLYGSSIQHIRLPNQTS